MIEVRANSCRSYSKDRSYIHAQALVKELISASTWSLKRMCVEVLHTIPQHSG